MKRTLLIFGILSMFAGLIWAGQGTGYFPYPKESFMISQMPWAYRGAVLAVFGAVLIFISRRLK